MALLSIALLVWLSLLTRSYLKATLTLFYDLSFKCAIQDSQETSEHLKYRPFQGP